METEVECTVLKEAGNAGLLPADAGVGGDPVWRMRDPLTRDTQSQVGGDILINVPIENRMPPSSWYCKQVSAREVE